MSETIDDINEINESMADRFGNCPEPVKVLLLMTEIRCLAEQKKILSVETEGNRLKCLRATGKKDDYIKIGTQFPRLTEKKPLLRLNEIRRFLKRAK